MSKTPRTDANGGYVNRDGDFTLSKVYQDVVPIDKCREIESGLNERTSQMIIHYGQALVCSELVKRAYEELNAKKQKNDIFRNKIKLMGEQDIRLLCGELTAQEMRTAKAILSWVSKNL